MHRQPSLASLVGLLLLALPALAAETVHVTINADTPSLVATGLVFQPDDLLLVHAEGAIRLTDYGPFHDGWFDPSGLGRLERAGQVFADSPFGILLGTVSDDLEGGFLLGELATANSQPSWSGQELKLGLNMSAADLGGIQGSFQVHVTRYTGEEADEATVTIGSESPSLVGTGIVAEEGDRFLVIGQGAVSVSAFGPLTQGWFDASGQGVVRRTGQILPDAPFGCLLGTFLGFGGSFTIGDIASFPAVTPDIGNELRLGLNMSNGDQVNMGGLIYAHVLRIRNVEVSSVDGGAVPGRDAIVAVDSYPNPFNPLTTVRFELASRQRVRVDVVTLAGKLVRTLTQQAFGAGRHELSWDGRDGSGRGLASGTYLLHLKTADGIQARKLMLVR